MWHTKYRKENTLNCRPSLQKHAKILTLTNCSPKITKSTTPRQHQKIQKLKVYKVGKTHRSKTEIRLSWWLAEHRPGRGHVVIFLHYHPECTLLQRL